MSLHSFLTRVIWLCVSPLVLLAAYLAADRVRTTQLANDIEAVNLAKNFATAIDHNLTARIGALHVLAASPLADQTSRWKELYEEAQGFRQNFDSHVILADQEMRILFNTRTPFGIKQPVLPRPKGRAAAPTAIETGMPAVGDIYFGPITNESMVAIAVPGMREGKVSFLVLATSETRQFQRPIDQVGLPSGWSLALLDGNGETIARRAPSGVNSATDVDAAGRFVVKSALSPWSVVLEIPRDIYRAPLVAAAASLAIAILGATLAGVLGGTLASRRLGKSVASLAEIPAPGAPVPDIIEIAAVRRLLDEAWATVQAKEATLKDAQRLAGLGNWRWDLRTGRHVWSEEIYSIYGRDPSLPPAVYPEVQAYFTAESWTCLAAAVETCLAQGTPYECDAEVVRADGTRRWISARGNPTYGADGAVVALHGTVQDITERKRAEEDIRKLNEQLEARVEARTAELARSNAELAQFAYVASHDLQEPLRMVTGYVQLLEKRLAGKLDTDTREFMAFAVDGALRMQTLILDILAYSRVGSRAAPLAPVDSGGALTDALALLASRIAETGAEVDAQALPRVMADRTQLVQVFQNLVGNAIKFCKERAPRVRIEARQQDHQWRFSVSDNGIGIASEYRGQLFVIFKRLHTRREYPGTGIGLAICKRIVERHGGEIGIDAAPTGGSVFWFTLPEEKGL